MVEGSTRRESVNVVEGRMLCRDSRIRKPAVYDELSQRS